MIINMKKKYLAALITAAVIITAITGCSDNSKGGEDTTAPETQKPTTSAEGTTNSPTETTEETTAETEADTALSDDELIAKLNEISAYVSGKFSKATLNRIYDEKSIT
ncbi:MAG: hypothetical protein K2K41_04540, partial [Ruminiclostridium sp.]|nr:hypothetical protein [Ruminiclostridium sp.]